MFTPRHVKHSKLLVRHAEKYLRYKADVLADADRDEIRTHITALETALREKNNDRIHAEAQNLDGKLHKLTPVTWEVHWRENVEVILVAINGQQVTSADDVISYLELEANPGDTVTLTVVSPNGERADVPVKLAARPQVER